MAFVRTGPAKLILDGKVIGVETMDDEWFVDVVDHVEPLIGLYTISKRVYDEELYILTNGQYKYSCLYLCKDGVVRQQCLEGLEAGEKLTKEEVVNCVAAGYHNSIEECKELLKRKKFRYKVETNV